MSILNNERTNVRSRLIYSLRLFDDKNRRLLGTVVDITPEGVMIRGREPVSIKEVRKLTMDLPSLDSTDDHLSFTARVKWCRPNKSGDYYSMGIQFVSLPPGAKISILKLIRNYCRDEDEGDPILDMNPPLDSIEEH
jgi:PilZ domain